MVFTLKRKRLVLIAAFVLINAVLVLGYTVKEWFVTTTLITQAQILVSGACVREETPMSLQVTGELPKPYTVRWEFGDGLNETGGGLTAKHTYTSTGTYTIFAVIFNGNTVLTRTTQDVTIDYCDSDVSENCCEGSFAPIPGKKYMISAWVKEVGANLKSFDNAYITLGFGYVNAWQHSEPNVVLGPFHAKGNIIDGWQRIEQSFTVPAGVETMSVRMNNRGDSDDVFFDDIRVYPFDGNMKSYVYDPETKRLTAEMDQNNYATIYEYDEEGEMIRVKKETERGVMTIRESRSGIVKKD